MKPIIVDHGKTIASAVLQPRALGISEDPEDQLMIMNVLTNTLYSDRVGAVLREYACNAADANVEAGKGDLPFEVRLPNKLEPTVSIRDFGAGMSAEQVEKTFAKLGRSTKRTSNAFTGMLGIGSKAGFAYGDSFMVTSFEGGKRTVYNLYRDKGLPTYVQMFTEATEEPDGIEIKVPVKVTDIDEFILKAERIFRYFKVRPKITGAKVEFKPRPIEIKGEGWRFLGEGTSVAIMGNVGYDMKASSLGAIDEKYTALLERGVELDFEIGEVEIAANREGLQYGDWTRAVLLKRMEKVTSEIGKTFTDRIEAAKPMWEAKILYASIFACPGDYRSRPIRNIVKGTITWRGEAIDDASFNVRDDAATGVNVWEIRRGYNHRLQRSHQPWQIHPNDKTTLVINDLESGKSSPAREREWFNANLDAQALVIFTFPSEKVQKEWWEKKKLTDAPTILLSSITPLVSVTASSGGGVKNSKHSTKVFTLDESASSMGNAANSAWWNQSTADLEDGKGIYVIIDGFKIARPDGISYDYPYTVQPQVIALRKAGLLKSPVFGFKKKVVDRLGKGWVPLESHLAKVVADKAVEIAQDMSDYLVAAAYSHIFDSSHAKLFPAGSLARQWLDEQHRMLNPKTGKEALAYLHSGKGAPWVKVPDKLPKPTTDLADYEKRVLAAYPMIGVWDQERSSFYAHRTGGRLQGASEGTMKIAADYVKFYEDNKKQDSKKEDGA